MNYYIAVNEYRSSASDGFDNTWVTYKCLSQSHQKQLLKYGLPVKDCWDSNGKPIYSTNGIRPLTNKEYKQAKKNEPNIIKVGMYDTETNAAIDKV